MAPEYAIAKLDKWLEAVGQDITLQRLSSPSRTVTASVSVRAHISDYQPHEITAPGGSVAGLQIGDSKVIMSPSEVTDANWPAAGASPIPRKGDKIVFSDGRARTVLFGYAAPYIGGELVRIELAIR